MAKVITVAHQKGCVGKSTLALNLATCFTKQLSVALVDINLQGSLYELKDNIPDLTVICQDQFHKIKELSHDLVIIDTPPYLSNRLPELFLISDFVLVPTKPGFFDVMAIRSTLRLINEKKKERNTLKSGIVLNMVKHRSSITPEVVNLLNEFDTPVLTTMIHDRVSFTRSPIIGGVWS